MLEATLIVPMKSNRTRNSTAPPDHGAPIAIVGMGGVFPQANNPTTFWDNIVHKKSAVKTISPERWIAPFDAMVSIKGEPDKAFTAKAALIDHFDFNAKGFLLPEKFLASLDPLFHLTLEAGRQAFDAANAHTLDPDRVGVVLAAIALPTDGASRWARKVVGDTYADQILTRAGIDSQFTPRPFDPVEAHSAQVTYLPAALLAAALGLQGGAVTLDAACASSLYAVKLACDQLVNGSMDAMLAGGVSRPDSLYTQVGFTQLKALSKSGRCAPFDQSADGLVVGEGAGIIVLKRLDDALARNNEILGIIRGIGLSNDLRGNLLAPDSEGQIRAMRAAYAQCGWRPEDVDLIECHGAGTPLGDHTELESLRRLWQEPANNRCVIGSVKSMVGHLLTAAGAASLIKTVMAMGQKTLPPSLNFNHAPAKSPLHQSPFDVLTESAPWRKRNDNTPRRAAVNGFGFGGINAHLLLEEHQPAAIYKKGYSIPTVTSDTQSKIAIVGMDAAVGALENLSELRRALFNNETEITMRPANRWKGIDANVEPLLGTVAEKGHYTAEITIPPDEFRILPSEIPDIIPQHLFMLRVAKAAAKDAGISISAENPRIGAIIGIAFDFEATDFHLRWALFEKVQEWNSRFRMGVTANNLEHWRSQLADAVSPSLTHSRTLGALGSMAASRIARELRLGGPCFTISAGAVSGVHALQMAVDSLQNKETDAMLIGGVDLMGDVRASVCVHTLGVEQPPCDGAAAVVLKRLEDAKHHHDTIYAVVDGTGLADQWQSGNKASSAPQELACQKALKSAGLTSEEILFTSRGDLQPQMKKEVPYVSANTASVLTALVTTGLALYHRLSPPFRNGLKPEPIEPRSSGEAIAATAAQTVWGQCGHVILRAHDHARLAETEAIRQRFPDDGIRLAMGKMPAPFPLLLQKPATSILHPSGQAVDAAILQQAMETATRIHQTTARVHQRYLDLSNERTRAYAQTVALKAQLTDPPVESADSVPDNIIKPFLPREQCLEFAIGSAAKVLGPEFKVVDTYPARVRLPDEPLMLVDRILTVEGEKGGLGPGRVVTEHDVPFDAWYLDGGRAPVCISVEAGQADLFLSGYLGIDLKVKGLRTYRLLDATVTFHRALPRPGETIQYDISIDKFIRQGDTYLFLFHFSGTIDGKTLITMKEGCAGFFTESEVESSGGIIFSKEMAALSSGLGKGHWLPLVPDPPAALSAKALNALRRGDLEGCFGDAFQDIPFPKTLWLPDDRMRLIHRVTVMDPSGGRFGRGLIRAEADISPDDWFLTCHFVDDMVMPGTLMYECCAQTLRVLLQAMGWITDHENSGYEPVLGIESVLKCRGPVTPATKQVVYEVEIREIGYEPEPFVIGGAYIYADGRRIVRFNNISMRLLNTGKERLTELWNRYRSSTNPALAVANRNDLVEFATGQSSRVFGKHYQPYDEGRFLARLPAPPFLMIDRIVKAEAEPWIVKPGGSVTAVLDVHPDDWFFAADRSAVMPYGVLLEAALQPCGFLAAYTGSALLGKNEDLRFRNLGGQATLFKDVTADDGPLTTTVRLSRASHAADMIIEHFAFDISQNENPVYSGATYFGFFTSRALARQEGVRNPADFCWKSPLPEIGKYRPTPLEMTEPVTPEEAATPPKAPPLGLQMPSRAYAMIDQIDCYFPNGGTESLGYIKGSKRIHPDEWFFKAHFYQDPVWPGSLGLEAFIQLLKYVALQRWPEKADTSLFSLITRQKHGWQYRGQVVPSNNRVTVEASITRIEDAPEPTLLAKGALHIDNVTIYTIDNFGICLRPVKDHVS